MIEPNDYRDKEQETQKADIILPEILTAKNIADYLHISRRRVYELFQLRPEAGGIPCFSIGASRRATKEDFFNWIASRKQA